MIAPKPDEKEVARVYAVLREAGLLDAAPHLVETTAFIESILNDARKHTSAIQMGSWVN
jgi:hypothetical protein